MSEELIKRVNAFRSEWLSGDPLYAEHNEEVNFVCDLALSALTQTEPVADQVNTDTVSVPREPTKQMLDAGGNAHWGADLNGNMLRTEAAHRIYNAMLRAAQEGKK